LSHNFLYFIKFILYFSQNILKILRLVQTFLFFIKLFKYILFFLINFGFYLILGLLEHLPGGRFSGSWESHNENAMSDGEEFGKLYDFKDEFGFRIKFAFFTDVFNDSFKSHISFSRGVDSGEKISEKSEEDVVILEGYFGDIKISECSHE
jgi:hypothetical protein